MCRVLPLALSALAVSSLLAAVSCESRPSNHPNAPRWTLTRQGLGAIRLCAPLDTVAAVHRDVRDTLFEYGEDTWPGKVVRFDDGRAIFAASTVDRGSVWTISVSSPSVQTPKGYHPGQALSALVQAGESLTVAEPEGQLVLHVQSEDVYVFLDSLSEARYFARSNSSVAPSLSNVPSDAGLRELFVSRDCARAVGDSVR